MKINGNMLHIWPLKYIRIITEIGKDVNRLRTDRISDKTLTLNH